jgi:hypothetical protein
MDQLWLWAQAALFPTGGNLSPTPPSFLVPLAAPSSHVLPTKLLILGSSRDGLFHSNYNYLFLT